MLISGRLQYMSVKRKKKALVLDITKDIKVNKQVIYHSQIVDALRILRRLIPQSLYSL